MPESPAILLVGHGTRDARGVAEFLDLSRQLAARFPGTPAVSCFLELAEPTIDVAIANLVASGSREILVAPVLLFAAGHAKRDIPAAVSSAVQNAEPIAGSVKWRQTDVLEYHPKLLELAGKRLRAALAEGNDGLQEAGNISQPRDDALLVLVGRGSYDEEATAAMRRFAAIHADNAGIHNYEVAFIAMAEPKYPAVLREAAKRDVATIVVQPHLLFEGELLEVLRADVCDFRREFPQKNWRLAAHLGSDMLILDALEATCRDARATFARQ
jgi:sirohydrochlorin cobaltochelatase